MSSHSTPPGIIIGVYNYKGGVGKTTNLINIAYSLQRRAENKILMIDADPQCNLTSFFTKPDTDREDDDDSNENLTKRHKSIEGDDQDYKCENLNDVRVQTDTLPDERKAPPHDVSQLRNDRSNPSIFSVLAPVFEGDVSGLVVPDLIPVDSEKRLYLLNGSTYIIEYESSLSLARADRASAVPKFGAFRYITHQLCKKYDIDFVFVDFGPSSGILNQVLVMSCDYILPPCFADFYSVCSADGFLNYLMPAWIEWRRQLKADESIIFADTSRKSKQGHFAFNNNPPKILPFIVTSYKMYNKKGGGQQVAIGSARWIYALRDVINSASPDIKHLYEPFDNQQFLPLLQHVGQIIQYSHTLRVPFIDFNEVHLEQLKVSKRNISSDLSRVNQARNRYGRFCRGLRLLLQRVVNQIQ